MKIIVLKFGGTSVGTIDRIIKISKIIISYIRKKYKVIVVTSAMSGGTLRVNLNHCIILIQSDWDILKIQLSKNLGINQKSYL